MARDKVGRIIMNDAIIYLLAVRIKELEKRYGTGKEIKEIQKMIKELRDTTTFKEKWEEERMK